MGSSFSVSAHILSSTARPGLWFSVAHDHTQFAMSCQRASGGISRRGAGGGRGTNVCKAGGGAGLGDSAAHEAEICVEVRAARASQTRGPFHAPRVTSRRSSLPPALLRPLVTSHPQQTRHQAHSAAHLGDVVALVEEVKHVLLHAALQLVRGRVRQLPERPHGVDHLLRLEGAALLLRAPPLRLLRHEVQLVHRRDALHHPRVRVRVALEELGKRPHRVGQLLRLEAVALGHHLRSQPPLHLPARRHLQSGKRPEGVAYVLWAELRDAVEDGVLHAGDERGGQRVLDHRIRVHRVRQVLRVEDVHLM
eukprot:1185256-Prorocentrum_minimum.AAC.1